MRRALLLAGIVSALTAAPAQAAPYLSSGEAARIIGRNLHRTWEDGVRTGSLATDCRRLRINRMRCYVSFQDSYGDYICGRITVTENRAFYNLAYRGMRYC